ncbi:MAG: ATP-binding protein [Chitinophagaceae bacterium]|jgi:signal transduction histidine kinase
MSTWLVIGASIGYLMLLFVIARATEGKLAIAKKIATSSWGYALSLSVYCTAWTFYGSVGNAASTGFQFLPVYLGPTIIAPISVFLLRKMRAISSAERITSLADFISARYGKNISLGVLVTVFCVVGLLPYISLQIKAITESLTLLTGFASSSNNNWHFWQAPAFYITILLAAFLILFTTKDADSTKQHTGLIAAVSFESVVKLVAFLAVGIWVCFVLFPSPKHLFKTALEKLPEIQYWSQQSSGYGTQFLLLTVLSALAVLLLPRQFQMSVLENNNEQYIADASWKFPLYLLIINLFVLPIAIAGTMLLPQGISADYFVLGLPLQANAKALALLVYIGGFSAATGMMIVEVMALSTMISNHVVIPIKLWLTTTQRNTTNNFEAYLLNVRRLSIIILLLLAFVYEEIGTLSSSLLSVGLTSFVAVAQLAPALLLGLYWITGNKKGAISGIVGGFIMWFFCLIIPVLAQRYNWAAAITSDGLLGVSWLKPMQLLGTSFNNHIVHGFVWSLLVNLLLYIGISLYTKPTALEVIQADVFVNFYQQKKGANNEALLGSKRSASVNDVQQVLTKFTGEHMAAQFIERYRRRYPEKPITDVADEHMLQYAENILTGLIGSSSAHIMMRSIQHQEELLTLEQVINMVEDAQLLRSSNKALQKKSAELLRATKQLKAANEQLKQLDEIKDEFLYTVTHELRTPLTSIRALSEILFDNPDLPEEQRQQYTAAIVAETERLSHLIEQVLKLERFEAGKYQLHAAPSDIKSIVINSLQAVEPLAKEKNIALHTHFSDHLPQGYMDKDLMAQVIYNVLTNAIKFAQTHIHIHVQFGAAQKMLHVLIQDDGPGIEPGMEQRIFDKFVQAKQQMLRKPQGSGLGLAICKNIMQLHGGAIAIHNTPPQGCVCIIDIPIYNL